MSLTTLNPDIGKPAINVISLHTV